MKRTAAFAAATLFVGLYGPGALAGEVVCPKPADQPAAGPTYMTLSGAGIAAGTVQCYDFGSSGNSSGQYAVSGDPIPGPPAGDTYAYGSPILDDNILQLESSDYRFLGKDDGSGGLGSFLDPGAGNALMNGGTTGSFSILGGTPLPMIVVFKTGGGANDPYWFAFRFLSGFDPTAGAVTWQVLGGQNGLSNIAAYAVPLPAAVWLLGAGFLGLIAIGRRRTAQATA